MLVLSIALFATGCGGGGEPDAPVVELTAESFQLGGAPWGVAVDGEQLWVSDTTRGSVIRLDARTGTPGDTVATGAPDPRDAGLTIGDDRLWVANLGGTLGVVDRATAAPVGRVAVGPGEPAAVAVAGGTAWVPLHGPGGALVAVDTDRLEVTRRVELPESAFAVAIGGDMVWVAGLEGRVFAVDAATGTVERTIELGGAPRGIALAGGSVWVTLRDARQVVRIDPTTGDVTSRTATEGQPWPIAAVGRSVWVAELEGRLLRIDVGSRTVTASARIGPQARSIAVSGTDVWVAAQSGTVARVRTAAP